MFPAYKIVLALWVTVAFGFSANATITAAAGTVQITRSEDDNARPARVGENLNVGDRIRTLAGASATLKFANGSVTTIQEMTLFTVRSLGEGSSTKVSLNLLTGGLRNSVKKLSANEEFTISTPSAIAGVRGTEIDVFHQGRKSRIVLYSGRAVVSAGQGEESLEPGEAAEVEEGSAIQKRKLSENERNRSGGTNQMLPGPNGSSNATPGGSNMVTNAFRPGGASNTAARNGGTLLQIMRPLVPPYLVGMAEKGSHLVIKVNDRVVVDEKSISTGAFRFNIESALVEDPTGEKENRILVQVQSPSGATAQMPIAFRYDRTPPSLTSLVFRVVSPRLVIEGGIGEAGFLTVAGNPVPLDPRGRVQPGFGIPLDRLVEGPNSVIAVDRSGNRQAFVWQVRKPRLPPPPPAR